MMFTLVDLNTFWLKVSIGLKDTLTEVPEEFPVKS